MTLAKSLAEAATRGPLLSTELQTAIMILLQDLVKRQAVNGVPRVSQDDIPTRPVVEGPPAAGEVVATDLDEISAKIQAMTEGKKP